MSQDGEQDSVNGNGGPLAEMKKELALRTRELKEALDRQAATAEILRVISGSPTNSQPVFDAIVQSGLALFPDSAISIALRDGDQVYAAAVAETDPARGSMATTLSDPADARIHAWSRNYRGAGGRHSGRRTRAG